MRITRYKTELNKDGINVLVKEAATNYFADKLDAPEEIVKMMNDLYRLNLAAEEYIYLSAYNIKKKMVGVFEISHGTYNQSITGIREIFIRLLLVGAKSFIMVHNHPTGDPGPSKEDKKATGRIKEAATIMGISFLDHIIIGENSYYSFKENSQI